MVKQCKNCGKAISNKATYCSDKCRMAYSRNPNKQPEQIQPEQPKTPTRTQPEQTLCKGCQKPVHHLVDICPECVAKGLTRKKLNLPDIPRIQISDKTPKQMNWQRLGLKSNEVKAYIIWSLKKSGILDHSVITIGNKMFGNYKQQAKVLKGNVEEFRAEMK